MKKNVMTYISFKRFDVIFETIMSESFKFNVRKK